MDVNFEELLSKLNFSDPINGEDLLKWILGEVDPILFSNNIRDNMINPLLEQIKGLYDKIGKTAKETESNKAAVGRLSEPLGLTLVYKESSKQRKKVRDSIAPIAEKLAVLYDDVGKEIDSNTKDRSKAMADPLGILDVRKEYKRKVKGVLSKAFDGLKPKNVEEASEKNYTEDTAKKDKTDKKKGAEQQTLADVTTINFSDEAILSLSKVGSAISSGIVSGMGDLLKTLKLGKGGYDSDMMDKSMDKSSGLAGFLGKLAGFLLIGGAAVTVITMFWKSHIKPWLEEKIGIKLDFMDKFKGIFEGLGKWMTLGGMGAGGLALKIMGTIYESIGSFFEKNIGKAFSALLGEGAEKGAMAGGVKLFSGATLSKILGKTLGGLSKAVLKGIPIIGSLFSFWFAYDSFKEGDTIGGFINIASGLANLLNFVLPGIGTGLSLGIDVLGAILDVKAGDGTTEQKQERKSAMLKDWGKSLLNILKKIPFIDTIINIGEAFYKIFSGDVKGGLDQLNMTPVGMMLSPFMALFDNIEKDSSSATGYKLDTRGFMKDMKKRTLKSILSWFPEMFGVRKKIAEAMGIDYNETIPVDDFNKISKIPVQTFQPVVPPEKAEEKKAEEKPLSHYEQMLKDKADEEQLDKEILAMKADISKRLSGIGDSERKIKENFENDKKFTEFLGKRKQSGSNKFIPSASTKKVDDLSIDSKSVYDPSSNIEYSLAPEDNILAYKSDGVFDKTLKDIKNVVIDMGKKINELNAALSNQMPSMNSVNVNNTSNGGGGGSMVMSGKRDPIFDHRADYWRKFPADR